MAKELIFVICNSGMKHSVALLIYNRVSAALEAQLPIFPDAFRHPGKSEAMERIWRDRDRLFAELAALDDDEMVEWCGRLPWIGGITKYHAAKNLGADVAKPDRWLDRIAKASSETVSGLCKRLAEQSGDRVATVDLVLWAAAANGIWKLP